MRVAYVCADPGVPIFGRKGASVHVQGVLGALTRAGAEVTVFARRVGGEPPPDLVDVDVRELGCPSGPPAERERLLAAGNDALAAAVLAEGSFDLVYERHALWSWGAMEAARQAGTPSVLEVNAPLVVEQSRHRALVDRRAAEAGVERAFAAASTITAVSEQLARGLETHRAARGKVVVVPNGVDPARFRAPQGPPDGPFTVAFLGTLKPWHGLDTLVEAFAEVRDAVPDARLLVIGDGPEREAVERALDGHGALAATRFTGAVDPPDVPALLAGAHVGVAPYPPDEGHYFSPLKVFEYMAAGLPVIASAIGQAAELVRPETGVLCPPGDAAALAAALGAMAADPAGAARRGVAGRDVVLRHHTWDRAVEAMLAAPPARAGAPA